MHICVCVSVGPSSTVFSPTPPRLSSFSGVSKSLDPIIEEHLFSVGYAHCEVSSKTSPFNKNDIIKDCFNFFTGDYNIDEIVFIKCSKIKVKIFEKHNLEFNVCQSTLYKDFLRERFFVNSFSSSKTSTNRE